MLKGQPGQLCLPLTWTINSHHARSIWIFTHLYLHLGSRLIIIHQKKKHKNLRSGFKRFGGLLWTGGLLPLTYLPTSDRPEALPDLWVKWVVVGAMRALSRVVARLVYQCFMVLLVQHLHNNDNNNNPFFFSRTTQTSLFASSAPLSNPHLNDTTLHLAIPKYFDNKRHFRKFEQSILRQCEMSPSLHSNTNTHSAPFHSSNAGPQVLEAVYTVLL